MTDALHRGLPLHADADAAGEADGIYDRCMLRDPAGIRAHLQQLLDKRCMLVASDDAGTVSMVTAPLALDDVALWVDVPPGEATLQRMLQCPRLWFDGTLDKVTLRFSSGPPVLGTHDSRPALTVPLPDRLLHLQRRELMRREPPPGALMCLVTALQATKGAGAVRTTIRDIGGGGLAVLSPDGTLLLNLGDLLPDCVIDLPQLGPVEVTLRVRHIRAIHQRGRDLCEAGCEFVDLPAAAQAKLFRYLMQLDRDQVARRRELSRD